MLAPYSAPLRSVGEPPLVRQAAHLEPPELTTRVTAGRALAEHLHPAPGLDFPVGDSYQVAWQGTRCVPEECPQVCVAPRGPRTARSAARRGCGAAKPRLDL